MRISTRIKSSERRIHRSFGEVERPYMPSMSRSIVPVEDQRGYRLFQIELLGSLHSVEKNYSDITYAHKPSQARVNATYRPIKMLWRLAVGASTASSLTFKSGSRCPPTHNLVAFGMHPPSGSILRFTCFLSRYKNLASKILDTSTSFRTVSLSSSDKGLTVPKNVHSTAFPLLKRRGAA